MYKACCDAHVPKAVKRRKKEKQTIFSHEKLFGFSVHFKLHIENLCREYTIISDSLNKNY